MKVKLSCKKKFFSFRLYLWINIIVVFSILIVWDFIDLIDLIFSGIIMFVKCNLDIIVFILNIFVMSIFCF